MSEYIVTADLEAKGVRIFTASVWPSPDAVHRVTVAYVQAHEVSRLFGKAKFNPRDCWKDRNDIPCLILGPTRIVSTTRKADGSHRGYDLYVDQYVPLEKYPVDGVFEWTKRLRDAQLGPVGALRNEVEMLREEQLT